MHADSEQEQCSVTELHVCSRGSCPCGCVVIHVKVLTKLKQLTLTPQRCVCVSESATGHHPHPAQHPSFSSLPYHWSQS